MIKLVCFDFDGVIAQTEAVHRKWMTDELDKYHVTYTKENLSHIMGGNMAVHARLMDECFGNQENYREHRCAILSPVRKKYDLKELRTPYVKELMQKIKENNKYICVCSNSLASRMEEALTELELREYVDGIYCGTDYGHAKPDPFIYLKSMEMCHVLPSETIVIEDSTAGIKAGKDSGAKVLAYKDQNEIADQHEADVIINNFMEAEKYIFEK